jgi:hypothetical protein
LWSRLRVRCVAVTGKTFQTYERINTGVNLKNER